MSPLRPKYTSEAWVVSNGNTYKFYTFTHAGAALVECALLENVHLIDLLILDGSTFVWKLIRRNVYVIRMCS